MDAKSKTKIIKIFAELSNIYYDLEDKYRALAYSKAIMSLRNNKQTGIGSSIQAKIDEIVSTGKLQLLEDLKNNPVFMDHKALLEIHGITRKFITKYNIKNIDDLVAKVESGEIILTNAQQLGLEYYEQLRMKIPRDTMKIIGNAIINVLRDIKDVITAEIVGSYRRGTEASKDIDILVVSKNENISLEVQRKLKKFIIGTFSSGRRKFSGVININHQERHLDIMYAHPDEYATSLMAFTGSAGFNRILRLKAIEMGLKLNESGLYNATTGKKIITKTEHAIFKKLNLDYIPPESRSLK